MEKWQNAIDAKVPESGAAHVERSARLEKQVQSTQAKRREMLAKRPVDNPSGNPLPSQNR
jgi:hypothetical protein